MLRRILSFLLCIVMVTSISAYAVEDNSQSSDVEDDGLIIVDEFENFDKMKSHSVGIKPVELDEEKYFGDTTGLQMGGASNGTEILYEAPFEIGSYTLYLCGDIAEYSPDFKFYISKDGNEFVEDKNAEHREYDGGRIYTNPEVLNEYRFIKIVYCRSRAPLNLYLLKMEIREEWDVQFDNLRIARTEPSSYDYSSLPSLKEAYKDYFPIGAACEYEDIELMPDLLTTQFNSIVSEGQTQFNGLEQSEGEFTFKWADRIYNWACANGITENRLHALFYYLNTPDWMEKAPGGGEVTEELLMKRYERHIKTVVSHFKGKVKYYDVCNELFVDGSYRNMFEWKVFGGDQDKFEDFVANCFKWAHEADPDARLVFLDGSMHLKDRRDQIWRGIIPRIIEKGVPKENLVLGDQGHYGINVLVNEEDDNGTGNSIEAMLKDVRDLGMTIAITELDLGVSGVMYASDLGDEKLNLSRDEKNELAAKKFASIFDLYREYADVIEIVTFWGVTDAHHWISKSKGSASNGVLFDYNFEPYPSYWRILDFEKKLPRWTTDDIVELGDSNGYVVREIQAAYGTPVIDGEMDSVWETTELAELDRVKSGSADGANGNIRCLWDEEHLYVYAEIEDDIIITNDNLETWDQDNVEIYIGEKNSRQTSYLVGDSQMRVCPDGKCIVGKTGGEMQPNFFDAKVKRTATGYNVEFVYNMNFKTNKAEDVIGFDFLLTDTVDDAGNKRCSRIFCDTIESTYFNASAWGMMRLVENYTKDEDAKEDGISRNIEIDDKSFSVGITEQSGIEFVSLKELMEMLGGSIKYNDSNGVITALYDGIEWTLN